MSTESTDLSLDIGEDIFDPEESLFTPRRLYSTASPHYTTGQYGSSGGRIISPRGGATNVRFSEPVVRVREYKDTMTRVEGDLYKLSRMVRGLGQTVISQSNNQLLFSLLSTFLGGPKLDKVVVENIDITEPRRRSGSASASSKSEEDDINAVLPATVTIKDTKYKPDLLTLLLPILMNNMGGQTGFGSSFGGGNMMGSNFFMIFLLFILFKGMNEGK